MKRWIAAILLVFTLTCCGAGNQMMDTTLELRSLLQERGCSFDAEITADYGDVLYTFTLGCVADKNGDLQFTVVSPESIAGITGNITQECGKLTFDDVGLAFDLLADGQLSPVSGPWVMMKALLSGYITSCGADGEYTRATIRDSYAENAMTVDIWIHEGNFPIQAEISWDNRRILTITVKNFKVM